MYVFGKQSQLSLQIAIGKDLSSSTASKPSSIPIYEDPVAVFNRIIIEAYKLGRRITALEAKELTVATIEGDWPQDFSFRSQLHGDTQSRLNGKFIGVDRSSQEAKIWRTLIPIAGGSAPISTYPRIVMAIREGLASYPKDRWWVLRGRPQVPTASR